MFCLFLLTATSAAGPETNVERTGDMFLYMDGGAPLRFLCLCFLPLPFHMSCIANGIEAFFLLLLLLASLGT